MGDYYGIIGKRALGEVSPCYRKIFSVCSSFHCTGRGNRNEDKYAKRSSRTLDCYGYDDEMSSQFHKELAIMFDDPFERRKAYLADLNEQAEAMFSRLVKQLAEKEGVTESLKAENQMLWVQKMNNVRNTAMEVVSNDLIYA